MGFLTTARETLQRLTGALETPDVANHPFYDHDINDQTDQSPGGWDQPAADAVLAAVNAKLDRALAEGGEADTPARRNVADAYRRVIAGYHRDRHPLLWESLPAAEALLARWRVPGVVIDVSPNGGQ
jgi:hypothetical protein